MKKYLSSLLIVFMVSGGLLAAEAEKPARNVAFTVNPLSMIFLRPSFNFQLGVSDKIALVFPFHVQFMVGSVTATNNNSSASSSSNVFGVGGGIGAKFFITGRTFEDSLYFQPVAEVGWLGVGKANFVTVSGSAIIGYGWVFDSGLSLNLGLGIQYVYINSTIKSSDSTVAFNAVFPDGELSLGYAW